MRSLLVIILTELLLTACALILAKPQSPDVRLLNLQLGELGMHQQRLIVELELDNPNQFRLPIKQLDYQVEINGRELARGALADAITLPANGATRVEVPVMCDLLSLLGVLGGAWQNGDSSLQYRVSGTAKVFGAGIALPLAQSGVINLNSGLR